MDADACCIAAHTRAKWLAANLFLRHIASGAGAEGDEDGGPALLGQPLHQVLVDVCRLAGTCIASMLLSVSSAGHRVA